MPTAFKVEGRRKSQSIILAYILLNSEYYVDTISFSSQETVDFVQQKLSKLESKDPSTAELRGICEQLFDHCLAPDTVGDGTGCDNMTAVLVKLRPAFENKPDTLPTPQTSSSSSQAPTKRYVRSGVKDDKTCREELQFSNGQN